MDYIVVLRAQKNTGSSKFARELTMLPVHVKNIPEMKQLIFGTQTYNISAVSDVYF